MYNIKYQALFLALFSMLSFSSISATNLTETIQLCASCHGENGNKTLLPEYPKLGGQQQNYLEYTLHVFQDGSKRTTPNYRASQNAALMYNSVESLDSNTLAELAKYYAAKPRTSGAIADNLVTKGRNFYLGGDLERGIPACSGCHSPAGLGNNLAKYPSLAGQNKEYIVEQLRAFKYQERGNAIMQDIAAKMNDEDVQLVASYVAAMY